MSSVRPRPERGAAPNRPAGSPGTGLSAAAALALVGLIVLGALSFGIMGGSLPDLGLIGQGGNSVDSSQTPDVVKPPADKTMIKGTILFANAGNIWSVGGDGVLKQLSTTGADSYPVWSPDGKTIYFIETKSRRVVVPCVAVTGCVGSTSPYTLEYPVISRMAPDGSHRTGIEDGLYSFGGGRYQYFSWLLQPAISPDGRTFALVSDAPDPFHTNSDVVLQLMSVKGGTLTRPAIAEDYSMGHNDPAWSPDGTTIAYTYNHREGSTGRPRIGLYNVATGKARLLTNIGYGQPSWSPDGRYMVAVRTSAKGRDIVILNARTGVELLRVTDDGRSFAPVWSPAGDQIAFLRASGQSIDLIVATLGQGGVLSVTKEEPLTSQSQLDGTSKPSWFIPASQLPTPAPTTPSPARGSPPAASGTP